MIRPVIYLVLVACILFLVSIFIEDKVAFLLIVLIILGATLLIYSVWKLWPTPISTPGSGSQIDPNLHDHDLSTNVYQAAEGDGYENVFDVSDVMRNLASRIGSLENSIETTAILRKQKEEIEEDLKKYVTGYNLSIFRMAANDLIDAYEYLFDAEERLKQSSSPESNEISQYLKPVFIYLQQGLAAAGIEQFTPDKGVPYLRNPGCDMSGKTPTTDKEEDGLIAEVEKDGWRSTVPTDLTQKEILRNARVSVYVLEK